MNRENKNMQIKYDIPKLEQIINDIFVLTGLSINFLDQDYERLCGRTKDNDFCSVLLKKINEFFYSLLCLFVRQNGSQDEDCLVLIHHN